MAPQLAWIGLGNMGRGMCKNLVEKGSLEKPLILYNRTTSRTTDLAQQLGPTKTQVCTDIASLVSSSSIIFLCLSDDATVLATMTTILQSPVKNKLIIDCSTIHPTTTSTLEARLTTAGALFAAMPVFGAPAAALAGTLVCVLAGTRAACTRAAPYTTHVLGRAVIDFAGKPARTATLLKIIGNTFILNMVSQLAEGHVLAETSGLGVDNLHAFVEAMFPGPYTAYSSRMLEGDYYRRDEPLFGVDLARKDARHAMSLAESGGAQGAMRGLALAQGRLDSVKEELGPRGDIPSVYGVVRKEAGLEFRNMGD